MKSSPMTQMAECLCRLGPMPLNPGRYTPPSVRDLALEVLRAKRRPMTAKEIGDEIGFPAGSVRSALKDERSVRQFQERRDSAKVYEVV